MAEIQYIPNPREEAEQGSRAYDCCSGTEAAECTAPTDVEALAAGAFIMDVSWTDNATGETGYDIRWRNLTTGGAFVDAPSEPANATSATVDASAGSSDGDVIEVQVRAVGASCSSDWVSDTVIITDIN